MKGLIIGFIGDYGVGKTTASKIISDFGFYRVSINEKVNEIACHLFSKEEIKLNKPHILNGIRRKGCLISKLYWFNLVMGSIPNDKNLVVFDDLSIDEIENKKILVYQIIRPDFTTIEIPDVKTIVNDGTLNDFTDKIKIEFSDKNLSKMLK